MLFRSRANKLFQSWNVHLQSALLPLYMISKACCLGAFVYLPLQQRCAMKRRRFAQDHIESGVQTSKRPDEQSTRVLTFSTVGVLHATGCSLAYATYHIISSVSQSSKLTDSNLVRVAIDLKNQYIGCILVLVLVAISLCRQPTLDALIRTLLHVDNELPGVTTTDGLLGMKRVSINNAAWLRNILLMFILGVGVKAVLEVSNCLMYIRDSGSPFSSNCLLLCIIPQTLCVVCELQFVAYALLICDRLKLLNQWLLQMQPHLERGNPVAYASLHRLIPIHRELMNAIRLLNECFGMQNAILLLYQFVTLVELGYNTCMMIVRYAEAEVQQGDSTEDFLETIYWVFWFVLEIFVLCHFSHETVDEAHRTAHLLRLPTVYNPTQRSNFHMISQEHLNFLNRKTCISCGGLFSLDLTLVYAIIGATTTYLIILIQFDQSFNGD